jgi:hypothetical protein
MMDETTWRTTVTDRTWMLEHVRDKASPRKVRLFACACVRRVWEMLPPGVCEAVVIAERYADNQVERRELLRAARLTAMAMPLGPEGVAAVQASIHATAPNLTFAFHAATWALSAVGREGWCEELAVQCDLVRCIFGNPFRTLDSPDWLKAETGRQMARVIADEARLADIPILADALEDAGCDDEEVLTHCRHGMHARGCWVIDMILGTK